MKRLEKPDLALVLDHYDVRVHDGRVNQKVRCVHPDHEDRDASCSVKLEEGVWHCFACGASGDSITLIQLMEGYESVADAFEFGQAFIAGGTGSPVRGAPRRGSPFSAGKGYQPRYRRGVSSRRGAARPFA